LRLWTSKDATAATGGISASDWSVSGVSIDLSSIKEGDLFVALSGAGDGHDLVAQAFENGASAALVSRVPVGVPSEQLLIVDDVLSGLQALGSTARKRFKGKVVCVTGSVGKTSTRDMLRHALSPQGKVHSFEQGDNSQWDVQLALANMPPDADYSVIEIGLGALGQLGALAKMVAPDVALITTLSPSHLDVFGSVSEVAREMGTIFEGLVNDGVAILNADLVPSELLRDKADRNKQTFGKTTGTDWQLTDVVSAQDCVACQARNHEQAILFKVGSPGKFNAMNGLGVLAAANALGADLALAAIALGDWHPPKEVGHRYFVRLDQTRPEVGIDLFDDTYHADPLSVDAALDMIASVNPPGPKGKQIAFLGDMNRLGASAIDLHSALAALPAMDAIDQLHCVGPMMQHLFEAVPVDKRGLWAATSAELARQVIDLVHAGDVVIVKGSFSMNMAQIVDAVRKLGHSVKED
jgi:UDP-N-acetylmuramoyl-tripeptide--D-alanyl-D-alanine ligase